MFNVSQRGSDSRRQIVVIPCLGDSCIYVKKLQKLQK